MAKSRTRKKGQENLKKFKEKTKKMNEQKQTPKTHLVPIPEWQSDTNLDMRGELLQAIDSTFQEMYQDLNNMYNKFQKLGAVMQAVVAENVKSEKIKITYDWNNGEKATEEEVAIYKQRIEEVRELQKKQAEAAEAEAKKEANASITGLVGPDGTPVATTQDLTEPVIDEIEREVVSATE